MLLKSRKMTKDANITENRNGREMLENYEQNHHYHHRVIYGTRLEASKMSVCPLKTA